MKKLFSYLLIIILFMSLITNIVLLLNNTNKKINVSTKDIQSIIMVDNHYGTAKEITKKQDIKAICDVMNAIDMHVIKNPIYKAGGSTYTFLINYLDDTIYVNYQYGEILKNNKNIYRINSTKLEDFWNLNYKERNFRYSGFY